MNVRLSATSEVGPILTEADLDVMKPSEALAKAVEAYPEILCNWSESSCWSDTDSCCPGAMLAHAVGLTSLHELGSRQNAISEVRRSGDYTPTYGRAVSDETQGARSWGQAIAKLQRIGC